MMQHNFCSQCGNALNASDKFCPHCGYKIDSTVVNQQQPVMGTHRSGTTGVFPRVLAYIPGLFWVPLAVDSTDKNNRECANQGLLLLLYCIVGLILFSIAGAVLAYVSMRSVIDTSSLVNPITPYLYQYPGTGFDNFGVYFHNFGSQFHSASNGAVVSNSIIGGVMALLHVLFVLYIPINAKWGMIHCINHYEPHILPLIGRIKIIKS